MHRSADRDASRPATHARMALPFLIALLLSGLLPGHAPALADEAAEKAAARANAIESLTPEQARRLAAEFPGADVEITIKGSSPATFFQALPLNGLKSLDAGVARALAAYGKETLILNGLTRLDADAARALVKSKAWDGNLTRLTKIDAATARSLAEFRGNDLMFQDLSTLDADAAEALANFRGVLFLQGLKTLDVAVAKAFAKFKGGYLIMGSLTALDADTAAALAEYKGTIGLGEDVLGKLVAKHPLSPQTALVYASLANGVLPFVTAFTSRDSVEIATALATRKGRLALPNLKKISPKTLTALIAKEDVEIPAIETLELIAEPDGSPTEDFVIPEGFEARQRQR